MNFACGWSITGESVKGAKHSRNGFPNQDAVKWAQRGNHLVLALSDGHGSKRYFRSHLGAKFGVETAVKVILEEADVEELTLDLVSKVKKRVKTKLPKRIISAWQEKVEAHYTKHPFSRRELSKVEAVKGEKAKKKIVKAPHKAYGATLISVLVTEKFIVYLQLGDGDILLVSDDGVEPVFSDRKERLGTATNSLCMAEPEGHFNFSLQPVSDSVPNLIMAATDGYKNSFPYDEDFFQVGSDFLTLAAEEGINYIENNLKSWLAATSEEGSGDDITVGLLFNEQVI